VGGQAGVKGGRESGGRGRGGPEAGDLGRGTWGGGLEAWGRSVAVASAAAR